MHTHMDKHIHTYLCANNGALLVKDAIEMLSVCCSFVASAANTNAVTGQTVIIEKTHMTLSIDVNHMILHTDVIHMTLATDKTVPVDMTHAVQPTDVTDVTLLPTNTAHMTLPTNRTHMILPASVIPTDYTHMTLITDMLHIKQHSDVTKMTVPTGKNYASLSSQLIPAIDLVRMTHTTDTSHMTLTLATEKPHMRQVTNTIRKAITIT